jgi:hypothetical protein
MPNLTDELAEERNAFEDQRPGLMARYPGEFVALRHAQVLDHDKSDESLAERMFAKYGDVPFYIARLEEKPTICELPSPESEK